MAPEAERGQGCGKLGLQCLKVEGKGRMLGFGPRASRGPYTLSPCPLFLYTLCPFPCSWDGVGGEEGGREADRHE